MLNEMADVFAQYMQTARDTAMNKSVPMDERRESLAALLDSAEQELDPSAHAKLRQYIRKLSIPEGLDPAGVVE